jgi:uncharacterized lipoprotein YddW (UPF0748 family)
MNIRYRGLMILLFVLVAQHVLAISPKREFRGMWITTVNNLDWPSRPGLPVEQQKAELIGMLNTLQRLNFNAVIFQIRPTGDAIYQSATEPWSHWLTGEQGKAPSPGWDPLRFIIDECHNRGMELHAWMNPFRLSQNMSMKYSPRSIASKNPDWVLTYGNKQYLDPGIPAVRSYLNNVVAEVVRKYNVDAIHFDDYFYPYPIAREAFPDTLSFKNHNRGYALSEIDKWRRENVDLIIESLNKTIKSIKPRVKFGISPFGVWKNYDERDEITGSATKAGNTNYDNLYADVINWQRKGWTDYLIPQLYWEIGHPTVDFITLANWWGERSFGRHVYVGHALYKKAEGATAPWKNPDELPEQLTIVRRNASIDGSAYFRMKHLEMNPLGFTQKLENDFYPQLALLPPMPWVDGTAPDNPHKIKTKGLFKKEELLIKYHKKQAQSTDFLGYLIYYSPTKEAPDFDNTANIVYLLRENELDLKTIEQLPVNEKGFLWISALDKQHNESEPIGPIKIKIKP